MCVQSGVKFDAFGVKFMMGAPSEGLYVRDFMQISSILDEFTPQGKALHITACQVPSDIQPDTDDHWGGQLSTAEAGQWRQPWSQAVQAKWVELFFNLALSRPFVESVCWRDLADGPGHYLPHGGLCHADLKVKPAFETLRKFRAVMAPRNKTAAPDNTPPKA